IPRGRFFNKKIRICRFDLLLKSEVPKKIGIRNHWRSGRMTADWATEPLLNFGHIRHMIEMAMSQKQQFQIDATKGSKPIVGSIRRVEQDAALRRFNQIAISLEDPA